MDSKPFSAVFLYLAVLCLLATSAGQLPLQGTRGPQEPSWPQFPSGLSPSIPTVREFVSFCL